MFRWYFRKLGICVVLLTLLVLLARDRTKNAIETGAVTRWHPKPSNLPTEVVRKRPFGRFFVFSPMCKIPYVDPFSNQLLKWEKLKLETCTDGPGLFSVTYDRAKRRYKVHLDKIVAEKHFASYSPFGCTYIEITGGSDYSSAQSKPINFNPDWIVPGHFLGMIVECHALANSSRVMQRNAFSFVQHPRNRNEGNNARRDAKKPSVFIFGIDSMSRMNFRRTMPLTSKFVRQEGWFEMEGYNSAGEDKMSNLVAILTDGTPWKNEPLCDPEHPSCLYDLTLLWQYFRESGYLTAYAEDVTSDYFDHLGMGSLSQAVDFYMRPFLVIVEKVFKRFGLCLGRRHSFSYAFDFVKQLIKRFVVELPTPLFGLFWTSSFTHNDFRGGSALDALFVRYLEEFHEYGLFKHSIVILVSDRGSRQGLLVDHPAGFLEERLPMLHIYLPRWYRRRYASVVRALQLNRNRLSSNCDLHLGIRQIMEQIRLGIWFEETTCQSIMKELPKNRSCDVAAIPEKYCACEPFWGVSTGESVAQIASVVVYRINKYLLRLNVAQKCHHLELNKVLRAERMLNYDKNGDIVPSPSGLETFHLVFTTKPYETMFWSMVRSNDDTNIVAIQLNMITRLGPPSNYSCVEDEMAKKFCICRNP